MKTTIDFMNAVKATTGLTSDYSLAKSLATSRQVICGYMSGKHVMSNENALKAAAILGIDPYIVLSAVEAERAKTESEKTAWTTLFERSGGLDINLPVLAMARSGMGAVSYNPADNLYIMLNCIGRKLSPYSSLIQHAAYA